MDTGDVFALLAELRRAQYEHRCAVQLTDEQRTADAMAGLEDVHARLREVPRSELHRVMLYCREHAEQARILVGEARPCALDFSVQSILSDDERAVQVIEGQEDFYRAMERMYGTAIQSRPLVTPEGDVSVKDQIARFQKFVAAHIPVHSEVVYIYLWRFAKTRNEDMIQWVKGSDAIRELVNSRLDLVHSPRTAYLQGAQDVDSGEGA